VFPRLPHLPEVLFCFGVFRLVGRNVTNMGKKGKLGPHFLSEFNTKIMEIGCGFDAMKIPCCPLKWHLKMNAEFGPDLLWSTDGKNEVCLASALCPR
jgi:hypothetical protein